MKIKKIMGLCCLMIGIHNIPTSAMQNDYFAPRNRLCRCVRGVLSSPYTYESLILGWLWHRYGDDSMLTWNNVYKLAFVSFATRMLLPQDITSWFVDVPLLRHVPGYRDAAGQDISYRGVLHRSGALYAAQATLNMIPVVRNIAPDGELLH